ATGKVSGNGTYTQTAGTTQVDGTLGAANVNVLGGTLHGTGTVNGTVKNQAIIAGDGVGGITLTGAVSGAGNYQGHVTFTGSLSPGNSPALIHMGHGTFASTNPVFMELGGLARGSEYDAINAITLDLGGTLDVDLIDLGSGLFHPKLGDSFDLMMAES